MFFSAPPSPQTFPLRLSYFRKQVYIFEVISVYLDYLKNKKIQNNAVGIHADVAQAAHYKRIRMCGYKL